MGKGDSLADQLFNETSLHLLAGGFEKAGVFQAKPFVADVVRGFPALALKQRITHIADHLSKVLPSDFLSAKDAILAGLPPPLDPSKNDNDFGHFVYASLGVCIEKHGLAGHIESSLDLLEQITQRFSMEFSLRAFWNHNKAATLAKVQGWTQHPSYHVRRLASEGTRPRLPWGQNVHLTPEETLPILDALHADRTRFVTRSVANYVNDITKTDPDAVRGRLDMWRKSGMQSPSEADWMRKHALRTLVKSGHEGAMVHLGYATDIVVKNAKISIPAKVYLNDKLKIEVGFVPQAGGPIIVDYVIGFRKANGKISEKTFKLKVLNGVSQVPISLAKMHHFDGTATTFKLYAGVHHIHLQLNGRKVATQAFTVS
ncbi:MAG: DNA alkylation repair protein [Yoonia sp.]|nr:DNA alkylation repair protein [Yoonia sp.]